MIKVIVTGATGKMGSRIASAVLEAPDLKLAGATERKGHPAFGKDLGDLLGRGKAGVLLTDNLEAVIAGAHVVVDFTQPEATLAHMRVAQAHRVAMVVGTTGFTSEQSRTLREYAREIPCVFSPNMSVGVNVLFSILPAVAKTLGEAYDMEIVEMHHRMKQDAPSGTALRLGQILAEARGRDLETSGVFSRHGAVGPRKAGEIGIQALRGGDVVGEHTVIFAGPGERLEITHRAHSRDTFAQGALRAARWVVGRDPGVYDMLHVLGLR